MTPDPESVRLLHGPDRATKVKRGTRCLVRDAEVVITARTDARTPWPRCRVIGH